MVGRADVVGLATETLLTGVATRPEFTTGEIPSLARTAVFLPTPLYGVEEGFPGFIIILLG
ncbi:hypothetical protein D3C80_844860 [compost metagenome]